MLPYEDRAVKELWPKVSAAYNRAEAFHDVAITEFFNTKLVGTNYEGLNDAVVTTVMGLFTKLCKSHRAVLLVARNGLGQDGLTLARSMYETAMLMLFILQKDYKTRTAMYHTYMFEQDYRMVCKWLDTPELAKPETREDALKIKKGLEDYLELWRPKCNGVNVRKHWSGHSLEWAASQLQEDASYQTLYRFMSPHAHAADLFSHIEPEEEGPAMANLVPGEAMTVHSIELAAMLLWSVASRMDEAWGLGLTERLAPFKPVWPTEN